MNTWHKLSIIEATSLLVTDVEQGLSANEAKKRLAQYGQTEQPPAKAGGFILRTKVRIRVARPV